MPSIYTIHLWHNCTIRFFPTTCLALWGQLQVCWDLSNLLLLLATLPTLASVYIKGMRGMYIFCLPPFREIYCLLGCINYWKIKLLYYLKC
jgi:hypothetical protein